MNKHILWFIFLTPLAFAQEASIPSLIKPVPGEIKPNEIVFIEPVDNHHFNLKAPHTCDNGIQVEFNARAMKCQFTKEGPRKLQVSVCDDQETFCKVENIQIRIGAKNALTEKAKPVEAKVKETEIEGFITNDPAKAIELAKTEKKLLLIDMFANWCPPCHEMEEFVFTNTSFADASKNFVKLRIDNDLQLAWDWTTRFKVLGLPTLLVVDPKTLEEIGRTIGYHPVNGIVAWLGEMEKLKGKSIAWAKKQKSEAQKVRVAKWYWTRGQNQQAFDYLKKVKGDDAMLLRLMVVKDLAWEMADQIKYKDALKQLIENFSYDIRVGSWTAELLEADAEMGKKYTDKAFKALDMWRKSKKLSSVYDVDYTVPDLWAIEGNVYNLIGDKEKSKAAYQEASKSLEKSAADSKKMSKGMNLMRATYLQEGGMVDDAAKIFKKLADTYPDEFVFNYRYARVLKDQKSYKKALKFADIALKQSYGDNHLRMVGLKAKILIDMNKKVDAKKLIEEALAQTNLPKSSDVWTHGRVQSLRSILADTEK